MRKVVAKTLVLASLLLAGAGHALDPEREFGQYRFDWPRADVGIPDEVADVVQDQSGFIWLATPRGLMRYDGVKASLFRVSQYPAVLSNQPSVLFVDSRDRLFIASEQGLSVYNNAKFKEVIGNTKRSQRTRSIAESPDGSIWLASDDGLQTLGAAGLGVAELERPVTHLRSVLWHGDNLYAGGRGEIHIIDGQSVRTMTLPNEVANAYVRDLVLHNGHVWGATDRGLVRVDDGFVSSVDETAIDNAAIRTLLSDRDGNLWFGGDKIIGRILPGGDVETPDMSDPTFGFEPSITRLYEDAQGRLWYTSSVLGVSSVRDTPVRRTSYLEGLPSPVVTALAVDEQGITYIATDSGIAEMQDTSISILDDFEPLLESPATTMYVNGTSLYVGTDNGIYIFDLADRLWREVPSDADLGSVNAIARGSMEQIFVAADSGLYQLAVDGLSPVSTLSDIAVDSLMTDDSGVLWIGSANGISRLLDGTVQEEAVELLPPMASIVAIQPLANGGVAAATAEHGIYVKQGGQWTTIGEEDGLPPEKLIGMARHGEQLSVTTGAGVFRVTLPLAGEPSASVQPLIANEQYRPPHVAYCCNGDNASAVALSGGQLLVATDDGVLAFDHSLSPIASDTPNAYIEEVRIDGQRVNQGTTIKLESPDSRVEIDYSAMQLSLGTMVRFRYRLKGWNDDWTYVDSDRTAQFSQLPPGDFEFELQASLQADYWSSTTSSLPIVRKATFTETTTFQILIWLGAIVLALLVVWVRLLMLRRQKASLELEIKERTASLQDVNGELQVAVKELEEANQTDPLTGLVNRRFFDTRSSRERLADRVARRGVLAIIDIDFFKKVNDAHGHTAGDEVLRQFASVLRSVTRQSDLVARWGGEEFVMIAQCPNDNPTFVLERITSSVRDYAFRLPNKRAINLSCSVGAIQYPIWPEYTPEQRMPVLLEMADAALYGVKMNGRDGWALLTVGSNSDIDEKALGNRKGGTLVKDLIDTDRLRLKTSRDEINLSLYDTVTRLHALQKRG